MAFRSGYLLPACLVGAALIVGGGSALFGLSGENDETAGPSAAADSVADSSAAAIEREEIIAALTDRALEDCETLNPGAFDDVESRVENCKLFAPSSLRALFGDAHIDTLRFYRDAGIALRNDRYADRPEDSDLARACHDGLYYTGTTEIDLRFGSAYPDAETGEIDTVTYNYRFDDWSLEHTIYAIRAFNNAVAAGSARADEPLCNHLKTRTESDPAIGFELPGWALSSSSRALTTYTDAAAWHARVEAEYKAGQPAPHF